MAAALSKDLRSASAAAIIDLGARRGEGDVVIERVFKLDIGDDLRAVVKDDVRVDDAPANGKFLHAG